MTIIKDSDKSKLVKVWEETEKQYRGVKDKQLAIINNNGILSTYDLTNQFFKSLRTIETDYKLLSTYCTDTGDIVEAWATYDIHLFNINLDVATYLKCDIILQTADNISLNTFFLQQSPYWQSTSIYTRMSDTEIVISKSIYTKREYEVETSYSPYEVETLNWIGGLIPPFKSKLILQYYNPMNL
jgi:hypothetical protein